MILTHVIFLYKVKKWIIFNLRYIWYTNKPHFIYIQYQLYNTNFHGHSRKLLDHISLDPEFIFFHTFKNVLIIFKYNRRCFWHEI
jgi:hypothetical protein